jgi:hypothetical protein
MTKPNMVEKNLIHPFSLYNVKIINTIKINTHFETFSLRLNKSGKTIIVRRSSIAIHRECKKIRRGINKSLPFIFNKNVVYL